MLFLKNILMIVPVVLLLCALSGCQAGMVTNEPPTTSDASTPLSTTTELTEVPVSIKLERSNVEISTTSTTEERVVCTATGNPIPSITWMRLWSPLPLTSSSDIYQIITNGTSSSVPQSSATLVIKKVERRDGGIYSCVASNSLGPRVKDLHLSVTVPVSVELRTSRVAILEGGSTSVLCVARGYPRPSAVWRYSNGQPVPFSYPNQPRIRQLQYAFSGDGVFTDLTLENLEDIDSGKYYCDATSRVQETPIREELTVDVLEIVSVSVTQSGVIVRRNSNSDVTVTCRGTGNPLPTVQWFRSGSRTLVPSSTSSNVFQYNSTSTNAVVAVIDVSNAEKSDEGSYYCLASNYIEVVGCRRRDSCTNIEGQRYLRSRGLAVNVIDN